MASVKLHLQPFSVPNFVRVMPGKRQDGLHETPVVPLSELDDATLTELCDEFRTAVFAKARHPKEEPHAD